MLPEIKTVNACLKKKKKKTINYYVGQHLLTLYNYSCFKFSIFLLVVIKQGNYVLAF